MGDVANHPASLSAIKWGREGGRRCERPTRPKAPPDRQAKTMHAALIQSHLHCGISYRIYSFCKNYLEYDFRWRHDINLAIFLIVNLLSHSLRMVSNDIDRKLVLFSWVLAWGVLLLTELFFQFPAHTLSHTCPVSILWEYGWLKLHRYTFLDLLSSPMWWPWKEKIVTLMNMHNKMPLVAIVECSKRVHKVLWKTFHLQFIIASPHFYWTIEYICELWLIFYVKHEVGT